MSDNRQDIGVGDRVLVFLAAGSETVPGEVVEATGLDLTVQFDADFARELGYEMMEVGRFDRNWQPAP